MGGGGGEGLAWVPRPSYINPLLEYNHRRVMMINDWIYGVQLVKKVTARALFRSRSFKLSFHASRPPPVLHHG